MNTGERAGGSAGDPLDLAAEIERVANQMFATPDLSHAFAAEPSPAPSLPAASAAPTNGAPAVATPPEPRAPAGFASPLAMAPAPAFSFPLLDAAPIAVDAPEPAGASAPAASTPYFLELAGMPHDAPASAPAAEAPSPAALETPVLVEPQVVPAQAPTLLDPHAVRRDFPILEERVHGKKLVWLDNAATTQKPRAVIERLTHFYEHENSNVHRAAHTLAARATDAYEGAREKVRRFLNAPSAKEIVFVRGATEAINLVAQSWGRRNVAAGDEVVVTNLEHHANIVPWQLLCSEKGAKLRVAPVDSTGQVILEEYEKLLGPKTRIVAFTHVSNALGTIVPAREMIAMAHRHGACVLLDGAQSAPHMPVDVQELGCDFFVFSGHKVFAPTGIGALFGKTAVLEAMPPWQGGGNMIADVTFERTLVQPPPSRFEAGTGNIADAVGLGAALDYVESLGRPNIERYEHELRVYAEGCLGEIPGVRIIGNAREKAGVVSFVLDGVPTEQVGGLLDRDGIAVRSGHHCAQPILRRFGLEATVRASFAPYNTRADVEALAASVRKILQGFRG